jgi:anaerobic selenocysteine-containing dehydrogenase
VAGLAAAFGRGAMSNNWTDLGNASLVVVMGANPVENHPASLAHVNVARDKGGRLIVVDPRKTRTALQCDPKRGDRWIRMRPGTDIAIINGIIRRIIEKMESGVGVDPAVSAKFFEFLNHTEQGAADGSTWRNQFFTDGQAGNTSALIPVAGGSRYTDARFIVNATGDDYERETINEGTATQISNLPKKAASVNADPNTVYNKLKAHVAPYTSEVVKDISGISPTDLEFLVDAWIDNSRCSSIGTTSDVTAGSQDPRDPGYRCTTMMYAMGLTQHTHGGQNVKAFATLQTLMGNNGRAGGGINALRGIHNVQGSTDMGVLAHLIPFYSGNPSVKRSDDANAFGKYMDNLWGLPVNGSAGRTNMNLSYDDAYNTAMMGLQQRGFINMTYNFFGGSTAWMAEQTTGTVVNRRLHRRPLRPLAQGQRQPAHDGVSQDAGRGHQGVRRLGSEPRRHPAEPERGAQRPEGARSPRRRRPVRDRDGGRRP